MKIERLKRNHKKQVIIGAVAICIVGGTLTFNLTRAKYKITESIPLVRGTVNYKVPDLRTVALYTVNDSGVYQETNDIPISGYALNKTKSVCKVYDGSTSLENAPVDSNITIEYKNGKVNFLGISKRNTRCYLYFDKYVPTASETLIANSTKGSGTPDFSKTSCTSGCEEATVGTYTISDGMYGGTSTYWRGNTTDNYVKFAGFCWRIVRINGDGSIRLIYDGATCHANGTSTTDSIAVKNQTYNPNRDRSEYVGWTYTIGNQRDTIGTSSNAKVKTEEWYNNIENNSVQASKITNGKFCNDRNIAFGYSWSSQPTNIFYYAGYDRSGAKSGTSASPTLNCPSGDEYTTKAGAITMDELAIAGAKLGRKNNSYYLYNGQYYWSMTPACTSQAASDVYPARMFLVWNDGNLNYYDVYAPNIGLRPVINLRSDVTFNAGSDGTQNNPYIVQ